MPWICGLLSVEFAVASPDVKDEFIRVRDGFASLMGQYPDQLPDLTAQGGVEQFEAAGAAPGGGQLQIAGAA